MAKVQSEEVVVEETQEPLQDTQVESNGTPEGNPVSLEGVSAGTSVTLADGTVITHY